MDNLLQTLLNDGVISQDQARIVDLECDDKLLTPSTVLVQSEFVSVEKLARYDNNDLSIELNVTEFIPDDNALALIEEPLAHRFCALALSFDQNSNHLVVVLDDLANVIARDCIRRDVPRTISLEYRKGKTAEIRQSLDKCYGRTYLLSSVLAELDQKTVLPGLADDGDELPIIRLIDAILQDAITRRASDIHLSPELLHVQIRYRIDGVLTLVCCLHCRYWPAMLVRIKVLSGLDIAETRLPQDGHLGRTIHGENIDFRVASFPLNKGENIVIRVLDKRTGLMNLSSLCGDENVERTLQNMIDQPSGLVLVCGPTGSGKTTTLYALVRSLDADLMNIMTLEDPVEYPISKIRQTRVNGNSAIDFADGVRGVLRQDPDVILVGEIRDADSCQMSVRAALTGHLVLSSTHASSAVGAIARLIELGVSSSTLANVLTGVVSQRLFRRICNNCEGHTANCRVCFGSGYSGRLALFECFAPSLKVIHELERGVSVAKLEEIAAHEGMISLYKQARAACEKNIIDERELYRVLGDNA